MTMTRLTPKQEAVLEKWVDSLLLLIRDRLRELGRSKYERSVVLRVVAVFQRKYADTPLEDIPVAGIVAEAIAHTRRKQ